MMMIYYANRRKLRSYDGADSKMTEPEKISVFLMVVSVLAVILCL